MYPGIFFPLSVYTPEVKNQHTIFLQYAPLWLKLHVFVGFAYTLIAPQQAGERH